MIKRPYFRSFILVLKRCSKLTLVHKLHVCNVPVYGGRGGGVNEKILEIMKAKYGQAITAFYIFTELGRGKLKLCIVSPWKENRDLNESGAHRLRFKRSRMLKRLGFKYSLVNFGFVYNLGTTPSDFFPHLSVFVFLSCLVRFVISSAALFMQRTLLMPK